MIRRWIYKILGIDKIETQLKSEIRFLHSKLKLQSDMLHDRIAELDKLTAVDADIGFRGECTIVLSGVYKGKAYVRFYDMNPAEFHRYVHMCKAYHQEHIIRHIDAPPEFKGCFPL